MAEKDLNQIWQFIKELLHEHDCVIVPGLGGFVGNREPARIDQVSHVITPPSKRIIFNQNLKTNDGLLANKVSQSWQVNYNEAIDHIQNLTEQVKQMLLLQKHYKVNDFGNFRLNADANYVFLPDKLDTYLPSSFGLAPLQAEPVAARAAKIGKARVFKDRKELKKVRNKNNIGPKALVAVLVLLLGINGWIFLQDHQLSDLKPDNMQLSVSSWFDSIFNDTANQQPQHISEPIAAEPAAEINQPVESLVAVIDSTPLADATVKQEQPAAAKTIQVTEEAAVPVIDYYSHAQHLALAKHNWAFPPSDILPIISDSLSNPEVKAPLEPALPELPGNEPTVKKMPSNKLAGKSAVIDSVYYIIGGVFCKERNAVKYYNQLKEKGYEPEIMLNQNINCKRVSYARFRTRKEAEMMLMNIKTSENPGAWILSQGSKK
jgi:nucleoid DNA-binding protein